MSDLLERLEKATGPDRELDIEIAKACGLDATQGATSWFDLAPLTSSTDAALALADRVFGHACAIGLYTDIGGAAHSASVHLVEQDEPVMAESYRTLALALCIAILKAHEATHDR